MCALVFSSAFHLETPGQSASNVIKRWDVAVDHEACLPGWGQSVSRKNAHVVFPHTDHRWRFYETLPVVTSKGPGAVEIASGLVSMPYGDARLADAAHLAGILGWTCSVHDEWSWYYPGSSGLVLFRPTTPLPAIRKLWDGSFKKWVIENRARLQRGARTTRMQVIEDIVRGGHMPLDLRDFEDCRQRYLREFAPGLFWWPDDEMAQMLEKLMGMWLKTRH